MERKYCGGFFHYTFKTIKNFETLKARATNSKLALSIDQKMKMLEYI